MTTPKVGLSGEFVIQSGAGSSHAAAVEVVHSASLVDVWVHSTSQLKTSVAFVDVGGTPPAAPANYFQAIDTVN